MSYKEFVPTAQQGSGYSHENVMSPTLGKYLERGAADTMPYWSPASRRVEEKGEEYSSIEGIVESTSQLAPSATEFVPGGGLLRMQSVNGLNLQAASWVPPSISSQSNEHQEGLDYDRQGEEVEIEPMVEVSL